MFTVLRDSFLHAVPVPAELPTFYFEITIVERGNDGPLYLVRCLRLFPFLLLSATLRLSRFSLRA
jgi:hypothetical protein